MADRRLTAGRLGTAPVLLAYRMPHPVAARLRGQLRSFVRQPWHDLRWRQAGKVWLTAHPQHLNTFRLAQALHRQRAHRRGPPIGLPLATAGPASVGPQADTHHFTGRLKAGTRAAGCTDVLVLLQERPVFFARTSKAAASASIFSLRCSSRSRSLMRRRSVLCCCRTRRLINLTVRVHLLASGTPAPVLRTDPCVGSTLPTPLHSG